MTTYDRTRPPGNGRRSVHVGATRPPAKPEYLRPITTEAIVALPRSEELARKARLLGRVREALYFPPGLAKKEKDRRLAEALETMQEIGPGDYVEGLLAVQMIAAYTTATECLQRANSPEATFAVREQSLRHGGRLLGLFTRQMDALNRYRAAQPDRIPVPVADDGLDFRTFTMEERQILREVLTKVAAREEARLERLQHE